MKLTRNNSVNKKKNSFRDTVNNKCQCTKECVFLILVPTPNDSAEFRNKLLKTKKVCAIMQFRIT